MPVHTDLPEQPGAADGPGQAADGSGLLPDGDLDLERLPAGHPSSPYDGDGGRRPPPCRLEDVGLPLPDEAEPDHSESGRIEPDRIEPDRTEPADGAWREAVERFKAAWQRHQERWPRPENAEGAEAEVAGDEPGSWCGDSGRYLSPSDNRRVDAGCDLVAEREERITCMMQEVEEQSRGKLVGLDHCLKGRDRLKDKVATRLEQDFDLDVDGSIATIRDAVRYTFQYDKDHYVDGSQADVEQLKGMGLDLVKLKNLWDDAEYKGVNSQWLDNETGQHFEVQFHTSVSFEAKELTHLAYERLRSGDTAGPEARELHVVQRDVVAEIPSPVGVSELKDYP